MTRPHGGNREFLVGEDLFVESPQFAKGRRTEEIGRQMQKADASQHAKEQALQSREALEERIKNVNAALTSVNSTPSQENLALTKGDGLRYSVEAALKILQS